MDEIKEKWENVKSKMEMRLSAVSFELWVKPLELFSFEGDKFILVASSPMAKQQLLKNHTTQLSECFKECFGFDVPFEIVDRQEKEELLEKDKEQTKIEIDNPQKQQFIDEYTFENFVVGKSNQFVFAAAKAVAENPGIKFNPLFIYGGSGLGKTHLLHSIGNYVTEHYPNKTIMYVTCENFTNDYIKSLQKGNNTTNSEFRKKYRNVDILMIDDIQFISKKTSTQEEFFHTFNDIYGNGGQIILSSDRHPKEIAELEERLRSRFSSGLIQDVQAPDVETRIAILRQKAAQERYLVEEDVIELIAERVDTNVRDLQGWLSKVYFYATLMGRKVATVMDVVDAFSQQVDDKKQNLSTEDIIKIVCEYYDVSKHDIKGKKKSKEIVEPRMIAIYLICEYLDLPLVSIAKIFGRDHTTIIHARDKITELSKTDNKTKAVLSDIKNIINEQ